MSSRTSLAEAALGQSMRVVEVGGERSFRRRLMELGLVAGTPVTVRKVAPLGDPLELEARGCTLSIRRAEAQQILVTDAHAVAVVAPASKYAGTQSEPLAAGAQTPSVG